MRTPLPQRQHASLLTQPLSGRTAPTIPTSLTIEISHLPKHNGSVPRRRTRKARHARSAPSTIAALVAATAPLIQAAETRAAPKTRSVFRISAANDGTELDGRPFLVVGLRVSNALISGEKNIAVSHGFPSANQEQGGYWRNPS